MYAFCYIEVMLFIIKDVLKLIFSVPVEWDAVGGADLVRSKKMTETHNEFANDNAKIVPGLGEMGEPVVLDGREAEMGKTVMKTEAFNLVVSDKISYTRQVPDTRDSRCKVRVRTD